MVGEARKEDAERCLEAGGSCPRQSNTDDPDLPCLRLALAIARDLQDLLEVARNCNLLETPMLKYVAPLHLNLITHNYTLNEKIAFAGDNKSILVREDGNMLGSFFFILSSNHLLRFCVTDAWYANRVPLSATFVLISSLFLCSAF